MAVRKYQKGGNIKKKTTTRTTTRTTTPTSGVTIKRTGSTPNKGVVKTRTVKSSGKSPIKIKSKSSQYSKKRVVSKAKTKGSRSRKG